MTVKELIDWLKKFPEDLPVVVESDADGDEYECSSLELKSGPYWAWSDPHNGPYVKMF